jgi:DNA-binding response OmpR family regulator
MERLIDSQSARPEAGVHTRKAANLLLVEDDRQLAEQLQCGLTTEGFLVDVTHDGAEALLKIATRPYHAVICDVMMPKVRGDELYRLAVETRPSVRNRFIFMTGFPANTYFNAFLGQTRCKFLFKPFTIEYLLEGVRQLTTRS